MKMLVRAAVVAAAVSMPLVSFAQANAPKTRAEVRAELIQLEKAGYTPGRGDDPHYPDDLLAAQARVAAQQEADARAKARQDTSGYGAPAPVVESGAPAARAVKNDTNALYRGH